MNDLTGKQFGFWTALKRTRGRYWECRCKCGKVKEIFEGNLLQKNSKGCRTCTHRWQLGPVEAGFRKVLRFYKTTLKDRGLTWQLTDDQCKELMIRNCFYCGTAPSRSKQSLDFAYNGIDRVDNSIGYALENCVPACRICNFMKGVLSLANFNSQIRKIHQHSMKTKTETA